MKTIGITRTVDKVSKVLEGLDLMLGSRAFVGVPADRGGRDAVLGAKGEPMNNAALAYIHDNGAPEANVPARPFMQPGIADAKEPILQRLRAAGVAALDGKPESVERNLEAAGMAAESAIKNRIAEGIPPPLAASTVAARRRRSKGSKYRRKARYEAGMSDEEKLEVATPLLDTGQLLRSITHVVRRVK